MNAPRRDPVRHIDGIPETWSEQDIRDVHYRSQRDPVDPVLVEPLGWVAYAAIRFHSTLRSVWTFQLDGDDREAHAWHTGKLAEKVVKAAREQGDPRADAFDEWYRDYGLPAIDMRNGVLHAWTYTAEDGLQALGMGPRAAGGTRITKVTLERVAGAIGAASWQLDIIRSQAG